MNATSYNIAEHIELENIESELDKFWRGTAEQQQDTPVVKSSTMNLVVLTHQQKVFQDLLDDVQEITSHHPGRMILVNVDMDNDDEEVNARVSATCQVHETDGPQICCELIVLQTGKKGESHLSGIIMPLLLPQLPVYVMSQDSTVTDDPLYESLVGVSDRFIIDSYGEFHHPEEFADVLKRFQTLRNDCRLSDLSWSRFTPWRDALAGFFDTEADMKYLESLHTMNVFYSGDFVSPHSFLVIGWLASQLKWQVKETWRDDKPFVFENQRGKHVEVHHTFKQKQMDYPGLYRIELASEKSGSNIRFQASLDSNTRIKTQVSWKEHHYEPNYFQKPRLSVGQLLCNELDILQQDNVYLQSLDYLLKAFHHG